MNTSQIKQMIRKLSPKDKARLAYLLKQVVKLTT